MTPLVIFDCDGVLVDSESIASAVFARHLTDAGLSYSGEDCRQQFTGLSLETCRQLIEASSGRSLPAGFFEALQCDTYRHFRDDLQPVTGVVDVLHCLTAWQWDFCVASSGSHEKMTLTLEKTGLHRFFAGRIFSAQDVGRGKPAPDLFLHAAQQLDFPPSACIVVEDSLPGVQAALAAGMQVCAFGDGFAASGNVQLFSVMSELPAMLVSLQSRLRRLQEQ